MTKAKKEGCDKNEQAIQGIAELLRTTPFQVEFKVKKRPQGIKVVIEVTQEQMDGMMDHIKQKYQQ